MLNLTSDAAAIDQNPMQLSISVTAAAVFGISMAMVRERSQSLMPPILFHIICAAVVMILPAAL
jgi:membrane protease YdiL (CAAX protease family)